MSQVQGVHVTADETRRVLERVGPKGCAGQGVSPWLSWRDKARVSTRRDPQARGSALKQAVWRHRVPGEGLGWKAHSASRTCEGWAESVALHSEALLYRLDALSGLGLGA
jgi:hypothetical protein